MSGESSFEFDEEVLDHLYKSQLEQLKELTLKLDDAQDINLCRKWLQVFNKTSEEEKIPRNCLCVLLCHQLKNDGQLSLPFTDLTNCNRNLTQILDTLDKNNSTNSELVSSKDVTSWLVHNQRFQSQENEICLLKRELMQIHEEIHQKEAKIQELNKIIEKCNQCSIENNIDEQIENILETFERNKNLKNFFLFSQLFSNETNLDFNERLTAYDKKLQRILKEIIKSRLLVSQKQLSKVIKSKEKRLKKCEKELQTQKWQFEVKSKITKLQYCSVLSKILYKCRRNSQAQFLDVLESLDKKCKNTISKFTDGLPYDLSPW